LAAVIATAAAAVVFNPLRSALQRNANRLMFGERDNPVAVLTQMGERLETTGSPEAALREIAETVARAFRLSYVAIQLEGEPSASVSYGLPAQTVYPLAMVYQGETVGRLIVSGRARGEELSAKDIQVLETIARQAGAAAQTLKLTRDLQQARKQLVGAREEERRRIRRDLHDGLGPQLASQKLSLDALDRLIQTDPGAARELILELKAQSTTAIEDIRGLIYNLRPPVLDDLGLIDALREFLARFPEEQPEIRIRSETRLPALPAAVELAAYRIVQEAVNNVVRHAGAEHCDVFLFIEANHLRLDIIDDGGGMPADVHEGIGLRSMFERAEELGGRVEFGSRSGGGIRVSAYLPLSGYDAKLQNV
jgi:signal transduction histidine kinase